jgi:hypothetical protein
VHEPEFTVHEVEVEEQALAGRAPHLQPVGVITDDVLLVAERKRRGRRGRAA